MKDTADFAINHVILRVIPQANGDIGLKVEVETNRPDILRTTLHQPGRPDEVIREVEVPVTHQQFGAVVPASALTAKTDISLPLLTDPAYD